MNVNKILISLLIPIMLLTSSCLKQRSKNNGTEPMEFKPLEKQLLEAEERLSVAEELSKMNPEEKSKHTIERRIEQAKQKIINEEKTRLEKKLQREKKREKKLTNKREIDFEVENLTGKTKYITCFSYVKQADFTRWHWDKSPVYKLVDGQNVIIDVDTIKDKLDRDHIYGYLGIFNSQEEAEDSIYELLPDENKISLDRLIMLKGKKVVIGIEKYGFKEELLDIRLIDELEKRIPELDFLVENKTGRPLIVTCFVYQKKKNQHVWRYDKTPIKKILPNEMIIIDVDPIATKYDRVYLRGVLAVFDETELNLAKKMTYELLPENNKLDLYRLMMLRDKKVVLEAEKYGIIGDIIKFEIKPVRKTLRYDLLNANHSG